jgi:RecA-family ATPase
LAELAESVEVLANQVDNNLSNDNQLNTLSALPINQILTSKIYEGGCGEQTRFNHLSKVIGYWIRRHYDGLVTKEEAIDEITSYNLANVTPSWPDVKLKQMINGIWNTHIQKYANSQNTFQQQETDNDILEPWNPVHWQNEAPARKWIIDNWLPRGYVTALYGDGGIGKSLLAQQLITALAVGKSFLGIPVKAARVYALMCEDDYSELWRRQVSINQHYQITMKDLGNIRIISRVCKNNLLVKFDSNNNAYPTKFFNNLHGDILKYEPDLVVLDTVADLFAGNENNRPQVRQFIQNICGRIAQVIDGAVLLCAHPSESGMQKGNGSCGSTAWNNTVRSRWYLKQSDNVAERILSRVK